MESAAFPLFAFYLDISFEQKHQFTGDGQSQAESFLSLCVVEPGEFLKDTLLLFLADTTSCVTDTEMQLAVFQRCLQSDASFFGEFQCIG